MFQLALKTGAFDTWECLYYVPNNTKTLFMQLYAQYNLSFKGNLY